MTLRDIVESLAQEFDQAVVAHDPSDPRHRSHGGQHTNGRCCPFGNLNPSAVIAMARWVKVMREALEGVP